MKKIKFASGTMSKLTDEYYTLELFAQDGKKVYSATLDRLDAAQVINDYNNIKMV